MQKIKSKLNFPKSELAVDQSRSQALQDLFVLTALNGLQGGYFVEIGASDARNLSNTYLLEKFFEWKGTSFDLSLGSFASFKKNRRSAKFVLGDATKLDFEKILKKNRSPRLIDYLSLDIEPMQNTLKALKQIPFSEYRFKVITYETDFYDPSIPRHEAEEVRSEARRILSTHGYRLIVGDVCLVPGQPFEDWWIDGSFFEEPWIKLLESQLGAHEVPAKMFFE